MLIVAILSGDIGIGNNVYLLRDFVSISFYIVMGAIGAGGSLFDFWLGMFCEEYVILYELTGLSMLAMDAGVAGSPWVRLLAAGVLGGLIGIERDKHGRSAGLRTHLLVSMGASLFMLISIAIAGMEIRVMHGVSRLADPGRIAAQVVTGIGFLGAGVIIKEGVTVRGLTTASCLWFAAGIGMACGGGFFKLGIYATVFALFALIFLIYVFVYYKRDSYRTLSVVVPMDCDVAVRMCHRGDTDLASFKVIKRLENDLGDVIKLNWAQL